MTIPVEKKRELRQQIKVLVDLCGSVSPLYDYLMALDAELNSEEVELNSFADKLGKVDQTIRTFYNKDGYQNPDMTLIGHLVLYVVVFKNQHGLKESRTHINVDLANNFIKNIRQKNMNCELYKVFDSEFVPINTPNF